MAEQDSSADDTPAVPRWFDELRPGGEGEGFMERHLRHSLMYVRRPVNRLLVTFDNLSNVNDTSVEREPWAFKFAQDVNISHLGVMAHVADWYRDGDLIARFEKLRDEGFFEGYDRVIFAGVSMGGFAAIAFGSLVPGAHVVSVNPQSTLDIGLVPWETRYEGGRRQDWTLPLSDAAALTAGLGRVNIFYDPYHALDKQHVGRFSGENIEIFHCRHSDHKTAVFMRKIGALKPVMQAAIFGDLDQAEFYRLYRARRDLRWYKNAVTTYFNDKGREETANAFGLAFRKRLRRKQREEERAAQQDADTAEAFALEDDDGFDEADMDGPEDVTEDAPAPKKQAAAPPPAKPAAAPGKKVRTIPRFDPKSVWSNRPMGERRNDRCAIVTTMKNEGPFMLEWIAYNRAIGFQDILIYTNDCDDGTDKIAMRLEEIGVAAHADNRFKKGASPQRVALRRALKHEFYEQADWIICADCDEFLNIRVGEGRLPDLFEATGDADAISFCWKLFGCGDQVTYRDRFIHEHFTWGAPETFRERYRSLGLKTIFRPSEVIRKFGVHRPKFYADHPKDFIWKDAGGQIMPEAYFDQGWTAHPTFSHAFARLHHYAVRSVDSFLVKRDRGRTNHIDRDQGVAYWSDMNLNIEQDASLVPMAERTRREFDALMADPEIARLHAEACAWHRAKIAALKANDDWAALHQLLQVINRPGEELVNREELLTDLAGE